MLATLVGLIVIAAAALVAVPGLFLVAELLVAVRRPSATKPGNAALTSSPSTAIMMPAHNEAGIIADTLRDLRQQISPTTRILVVADNCTDDTASLARQAGAEVIERHDTAQRGKGYALDFGVHHLTTNPPEVVVILDADCRVEPAAIERLAVQAKTSGRPAQAFYHMQPPPQSGPKQAVAAFAFLVRANVRQLGLSRLAGVAGLSGTGMAFPWAVLAATPLASGHIVEDMQIGAGLVRRGLAPQLCPDATVSSTLPASEAAAESQSRRWQQGHVQVLLSEGPRLVWQGLRQGNWPVLAFGLDVMIPPLFLYLSLLAGTWLVAAIAAISGLGAFAVILLTLTGLAVALALGLTWWRHGREVLSTAQLCALPGYALSRLRLHTQARERTWVRTDRE